MVMSDKNQNLTTPSSTTHVNEITRLSIGSEIKQGILISPNDIRIDGKFEGQIKTKGKVVIGEQAFIKGDIICQNADIWGKVDGTLIVGDVLTLMNTAEVNGTIKSIKLSVEKSAKFNGTCKIISQDEFNKVAGETAKRVDESKDEMEKPVDASGGNSK